MVPMVDALCRASVESVLLYNALEHPHLLQLLLELKAQFRVVLLDLLENIQDKFINLHLQLRIFVKQIRQG